MTTALVVFLLSSTSLEGVTTVPVVLEPSATTFGGMTTPGKEGSGAVDGNGTFGATEVPFPLLTIDPPVYSPGFGSAIGYLVEFVALVEFVLGVKDGPPASSPGFGRGILTSVVVPFYFGIREDPPIF